MNKTEDKFCPDCGRHLYQAGPREAGGWQLFCADCSAWIDPAEVLTLEQAQPLRVGYDASARKADE